MFWLQTWLVCYCHRPTAVPFRFYIDPFASRDPSGFVQVATYACIYTSKASNLARVSVVKLRCTVLELLRGVWVVLEPTTVRVKFVKSVLHALKIARLLHLFSFVSIIRSVNDLALPRKCVARSEEFRVEQTIRCLFSFGLARTTAAVEDQRG